MDWNGAFLTAAPAVEAATTPQAYALVVDAMLATLGDPLTRVANPSAAVDQEYRRPAATAVLREEGGVGVVDLRALGAQARGREGALKALARALHARPVLVLDLRASGLPASHVAQARTDVARLTSLLFHGEQTFPSERSVLWHGYVPQVGSGSPYTLRFAVAPPVRLEGRGPERGPPVVILADATTPLHPGLLALRESGRALLVWEGPVSDAALSSVRTFDMGEGVVARVRVSEPLQAVAPDRTVPQASAGAADAALEQALEQARKGPGRWDAGPRAAALPPARWRPDNLPEVGPYPPRAHRLLAAARLWNVLNLFAPHKTLMRQPWEGALGRFLRELGDAPDAAAYLEAVQQIVAGLNDGHAWVRGHPQQPGLRIRPVPFDFDVVEDRLAVTRLRDPARAQGISPGDIVLEVDGVLVNTRARHLADRVSASTPGWRDQLVCALLLSGNGTATAELKIEGAEGVRTVRLARGGDAGAEAGHGAAFARLPGDVGYMDLRRLTEPQVVDAFAQLKDARALIFDLRGAPNGVLRALAKHLGARTASVTARYRVPEVSGLEGARLMRVEQRLPPPAPGSYRGPTFTLIDARAISHAEETGLYLETLSGTTFVGSPTAGANGNGTVTTLPGGLFVAFTGMVVRHADGRPLQGVGLQPHVTVRPTIAGLRAGRDEVLERALLLARSVPDVRQPSR